MTYEVPAFLSTGALNWTQSGFYYPDPPPLDLMSTDALEADNPWIALAAIIEHAKNGNHTYAWRLKNWFLDAPPFGRICIVMMGAIGTDDDLGLLVPLMEEGSDDARTHACVAAARAGSLWLVPHMLTAWHGVRSVSDHEVIGFAISDLLEDEPGPIAENAGFATIQLSQPSPRLEKLLKKTDRNRSVKFDALVKSRFADVAAAIGADKISVWGGERFGVVGLAKKTLGALQAGEKLTAPIAFREKFEAATGVDCSSFFRDDAFQPLAAMAAIEEFLERPDLADFQDGHRYFFGHPVPE